MEPRDNAFDRLCRIADHRSSLKELILKTVEVRNLPVACEDMGLSVQAKVGASAAIHEAALGAAALDGILTHLHDRLAEVEGLLIDCARNLEIPE